MKTLITEFISLDGVVLAPGGASEDTHGGFDHGGWSMKYFDPDVMGGIYDELAKHSDALLQGRRTYQVSAAAWQAARETHSRTGSTACRSTLYPIRSLRRTLHGTLPRSFAATTL